MQMKEVQGTLEPIRTGQQKEDHDKERTTGSKGWAINRYRSARPEEDVREDDPAGPCGSCHHARGIGLSREKE